MGNSFTFEFLNYLLLLFQFWTLLYVSLPSWDAAAQHHFFVPSVDEDFTFISNDSSAAAANTTAATAYWRTLLTSYTYFRYQVNFKVHF